MVGRPVGQPIRTPGIAGKDVLLEVRNLSVTDARGVLRVDNLSFSVRAGEILGLAGSVGQWPVRTHRKPFGMMPRRAGEVFVCGKPVPPMPMPAPCGRWGLAHVPGTGSAWAS